MACSLLKNYGIVVMFYAIVKANVVVKTKNGSQDVTYFYDKAAAFGPSIPDTGIMGYVFNVNPYNACRPVDPPPDNSSVWIALIARDNCTFTEKVASVCQKYEHNITSSDGNFTQIFGGSGWFVMSSVGLLLPLFTIILMTTGFCPCQEIRNVQRWSVAAIVYNHHDDNSLERMHGDGTGIKIPAVFVGWSDGIMLSRNYCYNCTMVEPGKGIYQIMIDNDEPSYYINPVFFVLFATVVGLCLTIMIVFLVFIDDKSLENPYILWPFAVVVGTCFVLMLIFMIIKWCRDFRRKRRARLSTKHLKKIPTKKFKKGDEYDVCAICLEDYEEGDKMRLLPCSHVYHTKCIDPWLTKNKRSCPICKRKVIPGDDPDSDSDSSDEDDTPSERTPLLVGGSSGSGNRRSTFDNSGLPEASRPTHVSHVNEGSSRTSSDDSDSEIGAVGGVRPINLAKDNPLLSLPKSSNQNGEANKHSTNQNERLEASANHSIEETAVIETSQGADNTAFDITDDTDSSEEDFCVPEDDVVFNEHRKDERKSNGVV